MVFKLETLFVWKKDIIKKLFLVFWFVGSKFRKNYKMLKTVLRGRKNKG